MAAGALLTWATPLLLGVAGLLVLKLARHQWLRLLDDEPVVNAAALRPRVEGEQP